MNIYEIAKIAKVSPSTVSKVINGKEGVAEQTRNHVLKIVREYDFKPKISVNKSNNIAIIFRPEGNIFESEYIRKLLKGISDVTFEWNNNMLLLPIYIIPRDKVSFKVFCHEQRISGCIFINLKIDDTFVCDISGVVPIVTINALFEGDNIYSIISDDYNGTHKAIQYLHSLGHRRIIATTHDMSFKSHLDRYNAYVDALEDLGIPFDKDYIINIKQMSYSTFKYTIENLVECDKKPTAILAINDQEAARIILYLKELGWNVPDDISIVGFDDYSFDELITPALTTVKQNLYEMGKKAANVILDAVNLNDNSKSAESVFTFETSLVQRRSVKRITE